jgi:hypothetical protein
MSNKLKLFFFTSFMLITACGCITNASDLTKGTAAPDATVKPSKDILSGIKVGANFQKMMLDQFSNDKTFTEAYGLFSEGGWSDDGQTWVLVNNDLSQHKVLRIAPNRDKPEDVKANSDNLKGLKNAATSASGLKSIQEEMFDGLIYEYTVLKKVGDDIKLEQNTYIKSTDLSKHGSHEALVNAFKKVAP